MGDINSTISTALLHRITTTTIKKKKKKNENRTIYFSYNVHDSYAPLAIVTCLYATCSSVFSRRKVSIFNTSNYFQPISLYFFSFLQNLRHAFDFLFLSEMKTWVCVGEGHIGRMPMLTLSTLALCHVLSFEIMIYIVGT